MQIELQLNIAGPVVQIDRPLVAAGFGKAIIRAAIGVILGPFAWAGFFETATSEKHLLDIVAIRRRGSARRRGGLPAGAGYLIQIRLRTAIGAVAHPIAVDVNLQLHIAGSIIEIDRPFIPPGFGKAIRRVAIGVILGPTTISGFPEKATSVVGLRNIISVDASLCRRLPLRLRGPGMAKNHQ